MEKLFSYGTLQLDNVQMETFGRKLQGTKDNLSGYIVTEIKIRDQTVVDASGAEFHPILQYTGNPEDRVSGTVFEITARELMQADKYEVEEYARIEEKFVSGTLAWVYVDATQV